MFLLFFLLFADPIGLLRSAVSLFSSLVIPLKSDLAVELLEKGRVRFWLQADKISANGKVDYVFNESSLSQGEVSEWKIREPSVVCVRIISVFYVFWAVLPFSFAEIQDEL